MINNLFSLSNGFTVQGSRRVGFSPNKTSGGIFAEKSTDNLIYII